MFDRTQFFHRKLVKAYTKVADAIGAYQEALRDYRMALATAYPQSGSRPRGSVPRHCKHRLPRTQMITG